jgi:hypothetical protein
MGKGAIMATHWCLEFDGGAGPLGNQPPEFVLQHGRDLNLWLMQYQYRHANDGHDYQQNPGQLSKITLNWRAVRQIRPGDCCVASVRPYEQGQRRCYAIAEVIAPRKGRVHQDQINRTLQQRRHVRLVGTVEYTDAAGAFYEDFTDEWNLPLNNPKCAYCANHPGQLDEDWRYPQRIDVDKWRYYVPGGVQVPGIGKAAPEGYRAAAFPITERFFIQIRRELVQHGGQA